MLKENFRQNGEYQNEDLCHFNYQKLITKSEKSILKKVVRKILELISGYGTKPINMFIFILGIIIGFALLFYAIPAIDFNEMNSLLDAFYISGITFFTVGYGDIFPANSVTKLLVIMEAFIGVASMSYFLVLLSRKVIR